MSQLEVDKIIPQSGTTLTIGDSGDTITVASGATLTGDLNADNLTSGTVPSARVSGSYTGITRTGTLSFFASTGIDDNATSTAITINSLGQVELHGGQIESNNNTSSITYSGGNDSNAGANLTLFGGSHASTPNVARFRSSATETMRIDSSGRLLINTTSYLQDSDEKLSVNGISTFQRAGISSIFNRTGSDGDTIRIQKDGTTIGKIGVGLTDNLFISGNSSHAGWMFSSSTVLPYKNAALADNTLDIGATNARVKDIYFGGGLYVGGTGTANKLDDYEEGTFTPTLDTGTASAEGSYVKIGNLVNINIYIASISDTSTASKLVINNLPFQAKASSSSVDSTVGSVMLRYFNEGSDTQNLVSYVSHTNNNMQFYEIRDNINYEIINHADFSNTEIGLRASTTYKTT